MNDEAQAQAQFEADALDCLLFETFPGLVMRKDLTQTIRGSSKAPSHVIEFMLSRYCANLFDDAEVREGLQLVQEEVATEPLEERFGERTLPFTDPHGLCLAIVESAATREVVPWEDSAVPVEHQLRGMHAVRLWEQPLSHTERLLTRLLGFDSVGEEVGWHRYGVDGGGSGQLVEVKEAPRGRRGQGGTGGIHHVAWRVRDSDEQMFLQRQVQSAGLRPTPQIDRFWFKSVYFREPGGVLFELATDGLGFHRDEDPTRLGERVILPPWLEGQRAQVEAALPPLEMPGDG